MMWYNTKVVRCTLTTESSVFDDYLYIVEIVQVSYLHFLLEPPFKMICLGFIF